MNKIYLHYHLSFWWLPSIIYINHTHTYIYIYIFCAFCVDYQESNFSNCWSIWKMVKFWGVGSGGSGDISIVARWSGRLSVWWCRFRIVLTVVSVVAFTSLDTSVLFFQLSSVLFPLCIVPSCCSFQISQSRKKKCI